MKKFIIFAFVLLLIAGGVFLFIRSRANSNKKDFTRVAVEKGTIVEKAPAIGKIAPDYEIVVKSQVSGIIDQTTVQGINEALLVQGGNGNTTDIDLISIQGTNNAVVYREGDGNTADIDQTTAQGINKTLSLIHI